MRDRKDGKSKKGIIRLVSIDVMAYALAMVAFLAAFYLVPYELSADGTVLGDSQDMATFELPSDKVESSEAETSSEQLTEEETEIETADIADNSSEIMGSSSKKTVKSSHSGKNNGGSGGSNRGNTDTQDIVSSGQEAEQILNSDGSETTITKYSNDNTSFTITEKVMGSGSDTVTYYVADIYVTSLDYFKTAFADDTYGTNIKEDAITIAGNNDAILAITGDSYGNNTTGIVVRNGVLYRTDENEADVCVLYTDGTMVTYTADEFDSQTIQEDDVWQAWCFGPELLDGSGNILDEFNSTSYLSGTHPRAAIGYVGPGHYAFVIVDGRDEGYSRGVTLSELSAIMVKEGCVTAYNLDGGGSASMVYDGEYVNQASSRDITDIIYILSE